MVVERRLSIYENVASLVELAPLFQSGPDGKNNKESAVVTNNNNGALSQQQVANAGKSPPAKMRFTTRKLAVAFSVGAGLAIICGVLAITWPLIFNAIFDREVALRPGSKSFVLWRDLPVPIYSTFYFFNCTNADDVMHKHAKPNFQELGPYTFRMQRKKVNLTWTPDATVEFYQNNTWEFDAAKSNGSLQDVVYSLNAVALSGATVVKDKALMRFALDKTLRLYDIKPFVHHTVSELTFEGYNDVLIDLLKTFHLHVIDIPFDKFGWFYARNGSEIYDGKFTMYTGTDTIANIGKLKDWKDAPQTTAYDSYCSRINGTAGELFPPQLRQTSVTFFNSDMCRSLTLKYKEKSEFLGVRGYRYWGDRDLLANSTSVPSNWCFEKDGHQWPDGVLDVSRCKFEAPVLISYPHFLHADPIYLDSVTGISEPDEAIHQTYFDLEPETGIALDAIARFQLNMILQPIHGINIFETAPNVVFPMLWFEMHVQLTQDLADEVKLAVYVAPIVGVVLYAVAGLGLVILIAAALIFIFSRWRTSDDNSDIDQLVNGSAGDPQ